MIGLYSLVIAAGIVFSTFAITTFNSFSTFQSRTSQLIDYDTTALASSTRIAKESSEFLTSLRGTLNGDDSSPSLRAKRSNLPSELLETLIDDLKPHSDNQLSKTIAYGLDGEQDYKVELVNSDYIPVKLQPSDISYASVILSLQGESPSLRATRQSPKTRST